MYSRVVDERHTETSRRKLNMVNVAARCRLCNDPPPPPPCRLTASSDSAARLRPKTNDKKKKLIHSFIILYRKKTKQQFMYNLCTYKRADSTEKRREMTRAHKRNRDAHERWSPSATFYYYYFSQKVYTLKINRVKIIEVHRPPSPLDYTTLPFCAHCQ